MTLRPTGSSWVTIVQVPVLKISNARQSPTTKPGARIGSSILLALLPVLPGCIGPDRPPVSEVEVPTWEVGQEWHYKGSTGQWRNWTVVATEERRGYETYKVRIDLSEPDPFGRNVYLRWYDQGTLGGIEVQKGLDSGWGDPDRAWGDSPIPPRFPLHPGNQSYVTNLTIVSGGERSQSQLNETVIVWGWTTIETGDQTRNVVHLRRINPETNVREQFWYDPSVENHARYTYDVESITFNLTSWGEPN